MSFGGSVYTILSIAVGIWNMIILNAFKLLSISPDAFKSGGPWKMIEKVEPIFVGVAGSLVVVFFLWGFCSQSIEIREEMRFETILRLLMRLAIADFLVSNYVTILKAFCKTIGNLVTKIGGVKGTMLKISDADAATIKDLGFFESIPCFLIGLILGLVIIACAGMILYTVYFRFLKLLVCVPIGAIGCATLAGNDQISHSFLSYVRYIFCILLEAVVIALAIVVCNAFVSSGLIDGFSKFVEGFSGMAAVLIAMFEMTFTCVLTVGAVKGAENICQRALGL